MKSKITKIQKILTKGIALTATSLLLVSPIVYATTSLDDSYLEASITDKILYGIIGATANEIEENLKTNTTLYISNETQLRAFAEYVNRGNNCEGKEIILLNDIEVSSEQWNPIGNDFYNRFQGKFNGNGYSIKGVTYLRENKSYDELKNIGLFGVTGNKSIIKNLTSENFNINILYRDEDIVSGNLQYSTAGNIVGLCGGTVENCINKSNIYGGNDVGGIVGGITSVGTIKNVATINNCLNTGNVKGYQNIGGIVGRLSLYAVDLGNIEDMADYLNSVSKITSCTNRGQITAESKVGGIIGFISNENPEDLMSPGYIDVLENFNSLEENVHVIDPDGEVGVYVSNRTYDKTINAGIGYGKQGNTTIDLINNDDYYTNFSYRLLKGTQEIKGDEYLKAGNKLTIEIKFNKKLYTALGTENIEITKDTAPVLKIKIGEKEEELEAYTVTSENNNTKITYTRKIDNNDKNGQVEKLILKSDTNYYAVGNELPTDTTTFNNYKIESINKELPLNYLVSVDTKAPLVNTKVYVENALESGRYTAGKEILINVTTDEAINSQYILPELQLKFSKSGIGKYNYNGEKSGYAICKDARINLNGTTTWIYSYQIQEGDEGEIEVKYKAGDIIDLAGNNRNLNNFGTPAIQNTNELSKLDELFNDNVLNDIKIKNGSENDVNVTVEFKGKLYPKIGENLTTEEAPQISFDKNIFRNVTNIETIDGKTVLTYSIKKEELGEQLLYIKQVYLKFGTSLSTTIDAYEIGPITYSVNLKYKKFEVPYVLDSRNILSTISTENVIADTTAPTVTIKAEKILGDTTEEISNNITNADKLKYTFEFSEKVEGFTADDITVINGSKGTLSSNETEEKCVYTINITPSVSAGNTDNLQVLVEQNACQDLVGHGNVRAESTITVDKKTPILLSLEAFAASDIALNKDIDAVKENYRIGEDITIVATFSENIISLEENVTGLPELALQFSESGNAKGTVSGRLEGNKIIYTYTITKEDMGILSVKGFTGKVSDAAGNETKVTKRNLIGDTIIADTKVPNLKELKVVSENIANKAEDIITIEAVYDEKVYALITKEDGTKEIANITNENAPKLDISFGGVKAKGTMKAEYAENDKTRIIYTYTVAGEAREEAGEQVGEQVAGDNGILTITSYENKENVKVCDIAGNEAVLDKNQTGNNVIADTIRPQVTNITATVENPSITNTGIYHKEGNKVKITLIFDEEVIGNGMTPTIQVGFSEIEDQEPEVYSDCDYESDWNVNSKTIEYSYTIKDGDNGYLWVKVPEGQFKDSAGNTNVEKETTIVSDVFADTTAPTITLLKDTSADQENQTITINATFSEDVYDLNNNSRVTLTPTNAPKLIYSFGTGENKEVSASQVNGAVITYVIAKDPVNDNGTLHYELAKGNSCDRAGNEHYQETTDTTAPELESVEITTSLDYGVYCKKDTKIYVTAVFNEEIANQNMKLKVKLGDGQEKELSGIVNEDNKKEVIFTYTVEENDNGKLIIVDVTGNTKDDENLEDKTYGYVIDAAGNQKNIFNLTGITVKETAIADTTAPTLTITSDTEKTNKDIVNYTFKWSEKVTGFTAEDIEVTNGSKGTFKVTNEDENGYATEYTLEVDTTNEGRQIVKVNAGVCEDIAGNLNVERVTYNKVVIDYTKPVIRAKVNGGNYVLDNTDPENKKSTLKETIVVDEELSSLQYVWSSSETIPEEGWVSEDIDTVLVNSDINLTKEVKEEGTYYLYIKATDKAGNTTEARTKAFVVKTSQITLTPDKTAPTITFSYTTTTAIVGMPIGATITTDEDTIISYSWDNKIWTSSEGYVRSQKAIKTVNEAGTYTLYAKAIDKSSNQSTVQSLQFTVVRSEEEIKNPEIIFEDLPTIQVNGIKYVKVSAEMTSENVTNKMDKNALCQATPKYTKLTSDNKLKTGSEITINDETKYVIVVNGDVNGDGKVTFLEDVIMANNYRIGQIKLSTVQMLAADVNNSGEIEFIPDIVAMNNYRLGIIKSI